MSTIHHNNTSFSRDNIDTCQLRLFSCCDYPNFSSIEIAQLNCTAQRTDFVFSLSRYLSIIFESLPSSSGSVIRLRARVYGKRIFPFVGFQPYNFRTLAPQAFLAPLGAQWLLCVRCRSLTGAGVAAGDQNLFRKTWRDLLQYGLHNHDRYAR